MKNAIPSIPALGVGISYRSQFSAEVLKHRDHINFIEIVADHYIDASAQKLEELNTLRKYFTIIPHAINLSLGSAEGLDLSYLKKLAKLIDWLNPPYWSEHVSFSKAGGIEIGHLSPLPFNEAALNPLEKNINQATALIKQPLILENISYLVKIPGQEMEEGEFLTALMKRVDAGLLLDVTNLYYNSYNHQYNLDQFLATFPADKVVQLHFTGGMYNADKDKFIDNHSSQTPPEVWALMERVLTLCPVKGIILERDDSNPDFDEIAQDLIKAKQISVRHGY